MFFSIKKYAMIPLATRFRSAFEAQHEAQEIESEALVEDGQDVSREERLSLPMQMALVSTVGGVQVVWTTIMANLSPLLQSMGLSKAAVATILISQPISGVVLGPFCGAFSDDLRTRWGRRRPMIIFGAIATCLALSLLAWSEQLIRLVTCQEAACGSYEHAVDKTILVTAIVSTLLLSAAVQPMQAGIRALIVDQVPVHQQSQVSAWATRVAGVGSIVGFLAASTFLPDLPLLGWTTQFQALAIFTCVSVAVTVTMTCYFVHEEDSDLMPITSDDKGTFSALRRIANSVLNLPPRIRKVCQVQFCAWFAWFSFLYYTTTYIQELSQTSPEPESLNVQLGTRDHGAQAGSLASFIFAVVALICSSILPALLPFLFKIKEAAKPPSKCESTQLASLWTFAHALFGLLMTLALFATGRLLAICLIATAGFCWAVTQWVPFAIIGEEIAKIQAQDFGLEKSQPQQQSDSGVTLGVHNMAISLPQIAAGLSSSVVYGVAEAAGSQVPTAWVFAMSGISAFLAAILCRRLI